MPIYEFKCLHCGTSFDKLCRLEQTEAMACPSCAGPAKRCISGFAFKSGSSFKGSHGADCGGCSSGTCSSCGH